MPQMIQPNHVILPYMQTEINEIMNELRTQYRATGFNSYPKIKLMRRTKATDRILHAMFKDGLIERQTGLNDTLILLPKSETSKIIR